LSVSTAIVTNNNSVLVTYNLYVNNLDTSHHTPCSNTAYLTLNAMKSQLTK